MDILDTLCKEFNDRQPKRRKDTYYFYPECEEYRYCMRTQKLGITLPYQQSRDLTHLRNALAQHMNLDRPRGIGAQGAYIYQKHIETPTDVQDIRHTLQTAKDIYTQLLKKHKQRLENPIEAIIADSSIAQKLWNTK